MMGKKEDFFEGVTDKLVLNFHGQRYFWKIAEGL